MSEAKDGLRLPGFVDAIDVSQVQTIQDPAAVLAAGFEVAWVKASEGLSYCDPRVEQHLRQLEGVGILCSVYAFARVSLGQPRAQAEAAFRCQGDVFRTRVMLDLETAPAGVSDEELCDFAEAFVDRVHEEGVSSPTLYTYENFLLSRLMPAIAKRPKLLALDLHIARYVSLSRPWAPSTSEHLRLPKTGPWPTWKAWQYSGNAGYQVPGIIGDCDRNLIRGTSEEVRAWMGYPPK